MQQRYFYSNLPCVIINEKYLKIVNYFIRLGLAISQMPCFNFLVKCPYVAGRGGGGLRLEYITIGMKDDTNTSVSFSSNKSLSWSQRLHQPDN